MVRHQNKSMQLIRTFVAVTHKCIHEDATRTLLDEERAAFPRA